ncbi:Beta,beta-carotene 15,15'-dioxygenase [Liparis tanakae]|uniref:Beta,beta-carotene 15,15'-dioxygenase n=1 Tax=Liparis tanakae TaxID=230148 RepID=A0A4Z2FGH3_9TELE|nr:Beta,beta-carotene 15,15'-dioxygenase [Liparis tanakae]
MKIETSGPRGSQGKTYIKMKIETSGPRGSLSQQMVKFDIVTRRHVEWTQENCFPSEPVFVASPGAVEEDDGVILSSVISADPKVSPFLLVLDAKTWEEMGRASIPVQVHMDLHGLFIPAAV